MSRLSIEYRPKPQPAALQLLRSSDWQMSLGDRAALEGLLAQCRPRLAVEIGTAQGGSLKRVAAYSEEVHGLDLEPPDVLPDNVHFHQGDSHAVLPGLLTELGEQGRNVDFVLVDGDHSADGVRRDLEDLLASPAVADTIIVIHDTVNETVREGLERVRFEGYPKVAYVELDFVAGYMFREPSLRHQLWGGLGLVVVDARRTAYFGEPVRQHRHYEAFSLFREARDAVVQRESLERLEADLAAARSELERERVALEAITSSRSWRLTAPLRRVCRRLGRRAR